MRQGRGGAGLAAEGGKGGRRGSPAEGCREAPRASPAEGRGARRGGRKQAGEGRRVREEGGGELEKIELCRLAGEGRARRCPGLPRTPRACHLCRAALTWSPTMGKKGARAVRFGDGGERWGRRGLDLGMERSGVRLDGGGRTRGESHGRRRDEGRPLELHARGRDER